MADRDDHRALRERTGARAMLRRHGLAARLLHGGNAVLILVLLVSGLALGEVLPGGATALLGGHLAVNAVHRLAGVGLSAALVLLVVAAPRRSARLLGDVFHFRGREWRWVPVFLLHLIHPRKDAPFHDGRFDPAERVVFALVIMTLLVLCGSGVYLFWSPPLPPSLMGPMIQAHIIAAWVLIGALCLHILAGSGLLRTHRHITGAMFGRGWVPLALARELWPGWADRQRESARRS